MITGQQASGAAPEARYKLFECVARKPLGRSSHCQSIGTPLTGPLGQFGLSGWSLFAPSAQRRGGTGSDPAKGGEPHRLKTGGTCPAALPKARRAGLWLVPTATLLLPMAAGCILAAFGFDLCLVHGFTPSFIRGA